MDNIALDISKKVISEICTKHKQDSTVSLMLYKWIESLMNGNESIDKLDDVHDRLNIILKNIEVIDDN